MENNTLTIFLEGRIDTGNAAQIEKEVFEAVDGSGVDGGQIIIDADALEYISSAGLRVLMKLCKCGNGLIPVVLPNKDAIPQLIAAM